MNRQFYIPLGTKMRLEDCRVTLAFDTAEQAELFYNFIAAAGRFHAITKTEDAQIVEGDIQ